jgi:flagellar protein FliS
MLYDGALRFLEMGRRAMRDGDLETQNENLTKAQRIITELSVSLDVEQGGEVAGNLLALYSYANNRLIEANISNDLAGVEETARLLSELRASWV